MLFGWDISTSVIGFTVLDDSGKWVKSDYFDFKKLDAKSLHDKMDECTWWVHDQLESYSSGSHHHYFEDKLGNFAFGKTQMQTLMKLAAFNTLFSYEVIRIHNEICTFEAGGLGMGSTHIHPSTVKSIMKREVLIIPKGSKEKKKITLDFVMKKLPEFPIVYNRNDKPQPFCFDMADSFITVRAGYLRSYLLGDSSTKTTSDSEDSES